MENRLLREHLGYPVLPSDRMAATSATAHTESIPTPMARRHHHGDGRDSAASDHDRDDDYHHHHYDGDGDVTTASMSEPRRVTAAATVSSAGPGIGRGAETDANEAPPIDPSVLDDLEFELDDLATLDDSIDGA